MESEAQARGFKPDEPVVNQYWAAFLWGNHCRVIAHSWRHGQLCGKNLPMDAGYTISVILSWKNYHIEEELKGYIIPSNPQLQGTACKVNNTNVIGWSQEGQ